MRLLGKFKIDWHSSEWKGWPVALRTCKRRGDAWGGSPHPQKGLLWRYDECSENKHNCSSNATCQNTVGSFKCKFVRLFEYFLVSGPLDNFKNRGGLCRWFCFLLCIPSFLFTSFHSVEENCAKLHESGGTTSGVFKINPDDKQAFNVFCDQTTAAGGWTVFQKRLNGSVDFYRNWTEYQQGFGDLSGEFWLGLDNIHRLTSQTNNKLRVELEDFEGNTAYAEYHIFAVADETENYKLSVDGFINSGDLIMRKFLCSLCWIRSRAPTSYPNEEGILSYLKNCKREGTERWIAVLAAESEKDERVYIPCIFVMINIIASCGNP